jgi:hypothetical protein
MGRVRVISNVMPWANNESRTIDRAVLEMVTDIHRDASILAPKDTRALVNSGRISRVKEAHYEVTFGGGSVPYARRRHFENMKNPQT